MGLLQRLIIYSFMLEGETQQMLDQISLVQYFGEKELRV